MRKMKWISELAGIDKKQEAAFLGAEMGGSHSRAEVNYVTRMHVSGNCESCETNWCTGGF